MGILLLRSSGAGGGGIVDGQNYDFTSNDSIANAPHQEWVADAVNAGTTGTHFTRSGWTQLFATLSDWLHSTDRTRNNAKALKYDGKLQGEGLGPGGNCRGSYQFDVGAGGWRELYVSLNVYWAVNASYPNFQWKMFRFQQQADAGGPEVTDGGGLNAYMTNSVDGTEMPFSTFVTPDGQIVLFPGTGRAPQNGWFRMEIYMRENTVAGTADGLLRVRITNASGTVVQNIVSSNRKYRGASDTANVFRYFIWQLYGGNASDPGGSGVTVPGNTDWGDSIWHMDDFCIQHAAAGEVSPYRRVEISDGVSEPVLQPWVPAGVSGTSRRIKAHLGHLSAFAGCTLREFSDATTVVTTRSL